MIQFFASLESVPTESTRERALTGGIVSMAVVALVAMLTAPLMLLVVLMSMGAVVGVCAEVQLGGRPIRGHELIPATVCVAGALMAVQLLAGPGSPMLAFVAIFGAVSCALLWIGRRLLGLVRRDDVILGTLAIAVLAAASPVSAIAGLVLVVAAVLQPFGSSTKPRPLAPYLTVIVPLSLLVAAATELLFPTGRGIVFA